MPHPAELTRFPFVTGPLIDHHCHGLVLKDLERREFEQMLNEAPGPSPLGTTLFDSMIGLAVRRWCAPLLGMSPLADADDYLRRRREMGPVDVARAMLAVGGTRGYVVDTGFEPGIICGKDELADLAGASASEVVRLEVLAEGLLAQGVTPGEFPGRFTELLRARAGTPGVVGAKSVAAYRVGLDLPGTCPSSADVTGALAGLGARGGRWRIAHPTVNSWLAWSAIEAGLPLQVHVGYGDPDLDLLDCDPLRMTTFLRATQERGVPVLLLHNYPFHRHAAYLAQVFDHVFMDVGLATHNTGALSTTVIRESLELVPFGKLLYSSDAFGLAELYALGALFFRRGLSEVLSGLVEAGEMSDGDAGHVAALVCHENAARVYGLEHV
jgi:hypothetical protein